MSQASLTARPLSPAIGVEVGGVDFTKPLSDSQAVELRDLFDRHRLLVFRGQQLTVEDHLRLCEYVRPVAVEDRAKLTSGQGVDDNPDHGTTQFGPAHRLCWHSDYTFTAFPLLAVSLYATALDEGAAPTRFCNPEAALAAMPDRLRQRLGNLDVLLLANTVDGAENVPARTIRVPDDAPGDRYIRTTHPAIGTHRVTGTPFVMPSEQQASHFVGMSLEETDALLDEVFAHIYQEQFVYEHEWQLHDLVVWDNLALQHGRRANPREVTRQVRRITMTEKSMAELLAGTVFGPAFAPSPST